MFPNTDDKPPLRSEATVGFSVPEHVTVDLGSPIVDIRLGRYEVLRAPMPKATVDENSNSRFREHEISTTTELG